MLPGEKAHWNKYENSLEFSMLDTCELVKKTPVPVKVERPL